MKRILPLLLLALTALTPLCAQTLAKSTNVSMPAPTATAPVWGKLVLAGNTVTCYYATGAATPTTWTQLGTPQTIGFVNNPLMVGMYICSHDPTAISTGTIDNFSITPAPSYRLADGDVGAPAYMGSANLINGVWNLSGSGADVWMGSDQFNFQPWLVWGDCTVICRVTGLSSGNVWQKIGIMIRDGYNSGADCAYFNATYGAGTNFMWRSAFNNNADAIQYVAPSAPNAASSVAIGYGLTGSLPYVLRP